MKKKLNNFISKFIFSLFFVYIIILGVLNIAISLNKTKIENLIEKAIFAESVSLDNISNLPFIFISGTKINVIVNENLSMSIEDVYFYYRFWTLLTGDYERFFGDLRVDKISFDAHSYELREYIKKLKDTYSPQIESSNKSSSPAPAPVDFQNSDLQLSISKIDMDVLVRSVEINIRSMTEFRNSIEIDNAQFTFYNDTIDTKGRLKIFSIWSNMVFLGSSDINAQGTLTNLADLNGQINFNINKVNLAGIPIIEEQIVMELYLSNNVSSVQFFDNVNQGINIDTEENQFALNIDKTFTIAYNDFEEYNLLDYAFKPGDWRFRLRLNQTPDWNLNIRFNSPQHPDYGLNLNFSPNERRMYALDLKLDTHYFGALRADLDFNAPKQKGLFPMPSGYANLNNLRFISAGLVFSGDVVVDRVPNQNAIIASAFDIKMNNGLIGNAAVKLYQQNGIFTIDPINIPNQAATLEGSFGDDLFIRIKGYDVNGDFVAQNIRIPFFGIADSRYQGEVIISRVGKGTPVLVYGNVLGYLDGEKQIDAYLNIVNGYIDVPYFKLLSQDLNISGGVEILGDRTNTFVNVGATVEQGTNGQIPVDVEVHIKKNDSIVLGNIDDVAKLKVTSDGILTDLIIDFNGYSLAKLGLDGNIFGQLDMGFDPLSWTRFTLKDGLFQTENRKFHVAFDSERIVNADPNDKTTVMNTTNFVLGLDSEILNGQGYFSISEQGNIGGAFTFARGGSLSFLTSSYVWALKTDVRQFIVGNVATLPILDQYLSPENETINAVAVDLNLDLKGLWSDPDFNAQINIDSAGFSQPFQLVIPHIVKKGTQWAVSNLRFRSPSMNIDTDIYLPNFDDISASGAFSVLGGALKTRFVVDYQNTNDLKTLKYELPNLYVVSRTPMDISGVIRQQGDTTLFVSDNPRQGLIGSLIQQENNKWDIAFQTESINLKTSGTIISNVFDAKVSSDIFLNKMRLQDQGNSIKGTVAIDGLITGATDNPLLNGQITLSDLESRLRILRNPIKIPNQNTISITNNQFFFPDIQITAGRDEDFSLDGTVLVGNNGISAADLRLASVDPENRLSALNWSMRIPYISLLGKTLIEYISLTGEGNDLLLAANIFAENMNVSLELADALITSTAVTSDNINPALAFLSFLNFDINFSLLQTMRVTSQIFDLSFVSAEPIKIEGNISDNTVVVGGGVNVTRGTVQYLNTDLKVDNGSLLFSQEIGDPYPTLNLETSISRLAGQNDFVDIYVNFQGKLPNVELFNISSSPTRDRRELLALISGGIASGNSVASRQNNAITSREALANSVEIAENAFFISPLTQRLQRIIPFDTIEIKTDVLGNVTRVLTSGNSVTGLNILHGTELSIGQGIPSLPNLQARYDLRLESPENSSINTADTLTQIHRAGISYTLPFYRHRFGFGLGVAAETGAETQLEVPEGVFDITYRYRW